MIRWGIVGCGDVAKKRVAGAIKDDPDSELIAVCRRNQEKLAAFQSEFDVPSAYTVADELITSAEIDAVYIATPVDLHLPQTLLAAKNGKHVLVEKPMAMTTDECQQMVSACDLAGVRLGVAYYRQFYYVIERMKQLIAADTIGKVLSVSATTATPFAISPHEDGYWRVLPPGGGGALMDIGSHRLDLFVAMFGSIKEIKTVTGTVAADYAAEDSALAVMKFDSGIHGSLQVYFGCEVDPDEFVVTGTKGRLVSRPLNSGQLRIEKASGTEHEEHLPSANFNLPLITDFVLAIKDGTEPLVSGHQGLAVNRLMEQAYQNAGS